MSEKTPSAKNFEASLDQLEQLVRELETGDLGLEDALGRFEQGVKLSRQCSQALDQAQLRIDGLSQELDDTADDNKPA